MGIIGIVLFIGNFSLSFTGGNDAYFSQKMPEFVEMLKKDRKTMLIADSFRSLIFILIMTAVLFSYLKNKLSFKATIILITIFIAIDLIPFDKKYVNSTNFNYPQNKEFSLNPSQIEKEILKDSSIFRVLDLRSNPFASSRASYFFNSLGGYYAAKMRRIQDIYEWYIQQNPNESILKLLNVKYIINSENSKKTLDNYGPAFFVSNFTVVKNADEEIKMLKNVNKNTAVIDKQVYENIKEPINTIEYDSTAFVSVIKRTSNEIIYKTNTLKPNFLVLSEMYYPHGWKATIDNKEIPHYRINYLLRGVYIPEGEHIVKFKITLNSKKIGLQLSSISFGLIAITIFIIIFLKKKNIL